MSKRYFIASLCAFALSITLAISPITAIATNSTSTASAFNVEVYTTDSPYSLPKINPIEDSAASHSRDVLPSTYDLRDLGAITSVKDQNLFGTCWAFATIASFESALIKQGRANSSLDLSEMQLAYFSDWTASAQEAAILGASGQAGEGVLLRGGGLNAGGNALTSAYIIARGTGVVEERAARYTNTNGALVSEQVQDWSGQLQTTSEWDPDATWTLDRSLATKSNYQLHDMGFRNITNHSLPDGTLEANLSYVETMKRDLLEHGALTISFCSDTGSATGSEDRYTNTDNGARFVNTRTASNHMACVVGYDDNFSAANFNDTPSQNGAWIIKNSYGSMDSDAGNVYPWGIDNSGYFYLSYCDASIEDYSWFEPVTESEETSITLQYDLLGYSNGSIVELSNKSQVLQANVFTADEDMILEAVSLTSPKNNAEVKTSIYLLDSADGAPDSGHLATTQTDYLNGQFYTRIDLGEPVSLKAGQAFSVVQEIAAESRGAQNWFVSVECGSASDTYNYRGINSKVVSNSGESYVFQNGKWSDPANSEVTKQLQNVGLKAGNVMIKAFGNPAPYIDSVQTASGGISSKLDSESENTVRDANAASSEETPDVTEPDVTVDMTEHPLNPELSANLESDNSNINTYATYDIHPLTETSAASENTVNTSFDESSGNATSRALATNGESTSEGIFKNASEGSSENVLESSSSSVFEGSTESSTQYNSSNPAQTVFDAERNASTLSSEASLAKTGDVTQMVFIIFSIASALAAIFFLRVGIKRSKF